MLPPGAIFELIIPQNSVCGQAFAPDPTGVAYTTSQLVFRRPLRGRGGEWTKEKGKGGKRKGEGVFCNFIFFTI